MVNFNGPLHHTWSILIMYFNNDNHMSICVFQLLKRYQSKSHKGMWNRFQRNVTLGFSKASKVTY